MPQQQMRKRRGRNVKVERYQARISVAGKTIFLGEFATKEQAEEVEQEAKEERERYRQWCEDFGLPYG